MAAEQETIDRYPHFDILRSRGARLAQKAIELAYNGEIFIGDDDGIRPDDPGQEGAQLTPESEPPGEGEIRLKAPQHIGGVALAAA